MTAPLRWRVRAMILRLLAGIIWRVDLVRLGIPADGAPAHPSELTDSADALADECERVKETRP